MKKRLLSGIAVGVFLLTTLFSTAVAQPTNEVIVFKEPSIEVAVRNKLGISTGDVYRSDVEKITELSLNGASGIDDMEDIANFANLKSLSMVNNNISDISALANLTQLDLNNNKIRNISVLGNLT